MVRGAIPVDGSISRFLGDFFLYWSSVSPHSLGCGKEYEMVKGVIKEKEAEGARKKARIKRRTHGLQFRLASPFANRFKEPEHGTLQRLSWILPGDILKVGRKIRARRRDVIELDDKTQ